jgi:hypothetical protein
LCVQSLLFALTLLPYLAVRYFIGGVEIGQELAMLVVFLVGAAALTAGGVYASTLPKGLRIAIPILMLFGLQPLIGILFAMSMSRGTSPWSGLASSPEGFVLAVGNSLVYAALFLHAAQRTLAPPSSNNAVLPRLVALGMGLAALGLLFAGQDDAAAQQAAFAAPVFLGVMILGMCDPARPMPIHARRWIRRGALPRAAGLLFLPGAASATLFTMVVTSVCLVVGLMTAAMPDAVLLRAPMVFTALLFPAALVAWTGALRGRPLAVWLLLVLGLSVPSVLVAPLPSVLAQELMAWTMALVPVSALWMSLASEVRPVVAFVHGLLALLSVAVLVVRWRRAWAEAWAWRAPAP